MYYYKKIQNILLCCGNKGTIILQQNINIIVYPNNLKIIKVKNNLLKTSLRYLPCIYYLHNLKKKTKPLGCFKK